MDPSKVLRVGAPSGFFSVPKIDFFLKKNLVFCFWVRFLDVRRHVVVVFGAYTSHFSQHVALLRPPKKRLFSGSLYLARASLEATKVDEKKSGQLHSMLFSLSKQN